MSLLLFRPIAIQPANAVVPFVRNPPILPRVLGLVVPAGSTGLVGATFGVALPLATSFALGYTIGEKLLEAWAYFNQGKPGPEIPYVGSTNISEWPEPKPGQSFRWLWSRTGTVYGQPGVRTSPWFGSATTAQGKPAITEVVPNGYFPGQSADKWKDCGTCPIQGHAPGPIIFELTGIDQITPGTTIDPVYGPSTPGPDRAPLVAAASRPAIAPAVPKTPGTPKPAVPAKPKEKPKAPPPGTPAPKPAQPGVTPGPGKKPGPGETPIGPTVSPDSPVVPQRIGDPAPAVTPTMPTVDPARPPLTVPGPGTTPQAPPAEVPVTPAELIQLGELIIGQPGERPRPDLVSIATELGRQEQKLAGLLGGLGIPEAFDGLLDLLSTADPGTTYAIHPPCGTTPEGGPLPPVEIFVPPTIGENAAIIARLDAIAMLLDEHKQIRQPICKGKPIGRPVTVTAMEIP